MKPFPLPGLASMGRLTVRRISAEEARDHIGGPGGIVSQVIGHRGQVPGIGAGDLSYQPILHHGNPPQELGSPFKQNNYLAAKRCPVPSYDIVTVEHASGFVPRHHHGHTLGNASSHHFPHGRSGEVMRDAPHQSRRLAGRRSRAAKVLDALPVPRVRRLMAGSSASSWPRDSGGRPRFLNLSGCS